MPSFLSVQQIGALLNACKRHDAEKFKITRGEHKTGAKGNSTPRYFPATEFVVVMLLTGMRLTETTTLKWSAIDFASEQITLTAEDTKTGHARHIDLRVCPQLTELLKRMKLRSGEGNFVFGHQTPTSKALWGSTKKRLIAGYDAPKFTWHCLRRTCETFLVCSPGIYGAASTLLAAKRCGHSVQVAERHYLGLIRSIAPENRSLESAMEIQVALQDLLESSNPDYGEDLDNREAC
jgi:integrase